MKREGEGKRREEGKKKKGHFKEGTVILAPVPYDSVSSQLMLLLLGTGQEQRRPLYCKRDGKKLLDMFPVAGRQRQILKPDCSMTYFKAGSSPYFLSNNAVVCYIHNKSSAPLGSNHFQKVH